MEIRIEPDDVNKSSSAINYFSDQALGGKEKNHSFPSLSKFVYFLNLGYVVAGVLSNGVRIGELMRNSDPLGEAYIREIEKNRIREEIIVSEIIRKRAIEAEVRRELGLPIQREDGFSFLGISSFPSAWSDRRGPLLQNLHTHDSQTDDLRVSEEKSHFSARPETEDVESSPFQRDPGAAKVAEVKKGPVLFIAKPTTSNLVGTKRNAAAIGGGTEFISRKSRKKVQKEWTCDICKVSATCEQGLNEHLQGKKHKNKEAASKRNDEASKEPDMLQKKNDNSETTDIISSFPKQSDEKKPLQIKKKAVVVKRTREARPRNVENLEDLRKKFKFWCENCQIGCHSLAVLGDHKRGKKHISQLEAANISTEAAAGKEQVEAASEEMMENVEGGKEEEAHEESILEMKAMLDEVVGGEEIEGKEEDAHEEGILETKAMLDKVVGGKEIEGKEEEAHEEGILETRAMLDEVVGGEEIKGKEEGADEDILESVATKNEVAGEMN